MKEIFFSFILFYDIIVIGDFMKKSLKIILLILVLVLSVGCTNKDALKFH